MSTKQTEILRKIDDTTYHLKILIDKNFSLEAEAKTNTAQKITFFVKKEKLTACFDGKSISFWAEKYVIHIPKEIQVTRVKFPENCFVPSENYQKAFDREITIYRLKSRL